MLTQSESIKLSATSIRTRTRRESCGVWIVPATWILDAEEVEIRLTSALLFTGEPFLLAPPDNGSGSAPLVHSRGRVFLASTSGLPLGRGGSVPAAWAPPKPSVEVGDVARVRCGLVLCWTGEASEVVCGLVRGNWRLLVSCLSMLLSLILSSSLIAKSIRWLREVPSSLRANSSSMELVKPL